MNHFYLNSNNEPEGPIPPTDFVQYCINETSMVWKPGMQNWMRAGQIPELFPYLGPSIPPPPADMNNHNSCHANTSHDNNNQYKPLRPDNNMIWAVLATIFCCFPLGIYALIQASNVKTLYYRDCRLILRIRYL